MNNKGQFSIIAAMLVAVILVATVIVTYSTIRNSTIQNQPSILSAIDETNLAIERVLGFTVGYYGSILQVTGNSTYAKTLAANYLQSGLLNIANVHPQWGTSLNVSNSVLQTYWFTNTSYSGGNLTVNYDLAGLGIRGISYQTSCRLNVQIITSMNGQAYLNITKEANEPLITLGKQNFNFYRYINASSTWELVNPSTVPAAYANGTYQVDVPSGINPVSYVVQIEDQRGIVVVASSFNSYTSALTWNSTSVQIGSQTQHYVNSNTSNVDSSASKGTHSNFVAQQNSDSIYDTLNESASNIVNPYYPSGYNLPGSTQNVTGSLADLQSDNSVYMTFRSYQNATSNQTLYGHQESTSIAGSNYYLLKNSSADNSGTTLSNSTDSTGRKLMGRFVCPLTGVTNIPASLWTLYYRAYTTPANDYSLRASGGYLRVGSGTPNWGSTAGTISFWVKWNGAVANRPWGQAENMETRLSGANLVLDWGATGSLTSTTSFIAGKWYFIAIVWNQGTDRLYLYVGDQSNAPTLDSQNTVWSSTVSTAGVTENDFMASKGGVEPLNGWGDDLRYWNVDRSLASIQNDYKTELTGSESNLRSYFKLNNNLTDIGPNNNNGTAMGSTSFSTDVPFNTSSTVHGDADVLIRKADGTVRQTVATDVANSNNLTGSWSTAYGTYSWSNYTVADQTDYLEIDYYLHVTSNGTGTAYLRIDDNTLAPTNLTRAENIFLPSQYVSEVEFYGNSDLGSWANLTWITDSSFTISGVNATFQLFNYQTGTYPTSGNGFISALIGTADIAETQNITSNPTYFRNATGYWKIKVKAYASTQFDWKADLVKYQTLSVNCELDLEEQWTNANYTNAQLCIRTGTLSSEALKVDVWNGSAWINVLGSLNVSSWNNVTVTAYLQPSNFTIRFKGTIETSDSVQDWWQIDAALLAVWPTSDLYSLSRQGTIIGELLQNGTMRWLGQNLILSNSTSAVPFPPIPVKSIHVNETINSVNSEVPFQTEDWSSTYRIPLGLTSNASIFSSRTMLVFLATPNVSKVTIWWNGSDTASQTSYAYTNKYFSDSPSSGRLSNGFTALQFSSDFTVTSTAGNSLSTANFMRRINGQNSTYGSGLAYVITNGVVRDVVHQEAEWPNGVTNCSDVYSDIVLTLPANTTYYTYQLRLIFVQSQQNRTINDLGAVWMTPLNGQLQTENGTANGLPIVSNFTDLFYNYSTSSWAHHWSQSISGTKGAGIMFADSANQNLYIFDSITGIKTGGLNANSTVGTIQLLPVAKSQLNFNTTLDPRMQDIIWYGAVATFDATTPIYNNYDQTGLWMIVEYPPAVAVTTENYQ